MKPTCTKENPAPVAYRTTSFGREVQTFNHRYSHPDVTEECIDSDHGDIEYFCPNCKKGYIAEGPDY